MESDGDRMSDYAEFMAGTDPTNAASKLVMLSAAIQTNRTVRLQWAAIPGRIYQVASSTNLSSWTPLTDWMQASGSPMTYSGTNLNTRSGFFRVQVRP